MRDRLDVFILALRHYCMMNGAFTDLLSAIEYAQEAVAEADHENAVKERQAERAASEAAHDRYGSGE